MTKRAMGLRRIILMVIAGIIATNRIKSENRINKGKVRDASVSTGEAIET